MYLMGDLLVLDQFDRDTIEQMFLAEIEFHETTITKDLLIQLVRQAEEKALQPQYNSAWPVCSDGRSCAPAFALPLAANRSDVIMHIWRAHAENP